MEKLIDACFELLMFTKYHDYPKEYTEEFFELTRLIDCLETVMIKGGFVKSQAFRQPAVQPDKTG